MSSDALQYRQLRTPRQHGGVLIEPGWSDVASLIEQNIGKLTGRHDDIQGRDLGDFREEARREVVAAAYEYTEGYLSLSGPRVAQPSRLLLAGHQPELFHPGVWFKNFALAHLSRQLGGVAGGSLALNLVVDNDLARATSVRAPARRKEGLSVSRIRLDRAGGDVPYEQRDVLDYSLFDSFPERVAETLRPWGVEPLVTRFWPSAQEAARRTRKLGLALAQARHQVEAAWGAETLELPMSVACDTWSFRWFASHLLAHLPRFREHYNQALRDYRHVHGIRSRSHPVADLDLQQDWLEAPFWIWSDEEPWRRPLFVRQAGKEVELTDRRQVVLRWPLVPEGNADRAAEAWGAARRRGLRIRPRALVTTMFARLACGDLFLHGIGGAKYDQLTDEILRRFFGVEPPGYLTISATILLPVSRDDVTPEDVRRLEHCLRELRFHPEKHAPTTPEVLELAARKRDWIARQLPKGSRKERHQVIERTNLALQPLVEPTRQQVIRELADLRERLQNTQVLGSREFSFCLFPESMLQSTFHELLPGWMG